MKAKIIIGASVLALVLLGVALGFQLIRGKPGTQEGKQPQGIIKTTTGKTPDSYKSADEILRARNFPALMNEFLQDENPLFQIEASLVLADWEEANGFETILSKYAKEEGRYGAQASAALAKMGVERDENLAALREQLHSRDWLVRRWAALALGQAGDKSAIPLLKEALDDKVTAVRICAADALAVLGDESAIAFLREHLNHFDSAVVNAAAEALAKVGDDSALPFFQKSLEHEYIFFRLDAAKYLAFLGDNSGIPLLERALESDNDRVRLIGYKNLAEIALKKQR